MICPRNSFICNFFQRLLWLWRGIIFEQILAKNYFCSIHANFSNKIDSKFKINHTFGNAFSTLFWFIQYLSSIHFLNRLYSSTQSLFNKSRHILIFQILIFAIEFEFGTIPFLFWNKKLLHFLIFKMLLNEERYR